MFETDRLPQPWLGPLLKRDEVWVPCRQNFEAFSSSGFPEHKMRIVGGSLDFELFSPGVDPYPLEIEEERFVFLTNFDFSERKGWDVLLRAWSVAFTRDDPVCLVLKTGSFYRADGYVEERIAAFLRSTLGARADRLAPIHLLTDVLPARDMPRLYAAADAYVLASRGEGWGRPFMEAQAMGLPTIASRWGGQREFMDEDTSFLVDGRLVEVPRDAELFNDLYWGHRWFEPDPDDLAARLVEIAADWSAAVARAAPARQRLIDRFGPDAIARRLREAGRDAMGRLVRPEARSCVLRGRFGSTESLAVVNDGLAVGLEAAGWRVDTREPGADPEQTTAPAISHSWPHDFSPSTAGPSVVIVPWEYGAPPADWVRDARRFADRIWVPSEYVRRGFVEGGVPPGIVEVIPNGFDPARLSPEGSRFELPVDAACVFLFVGGTIWRKGIDLLVSAWAEAFTPADEVALVIKDFGAASWYRGQTAQDQLRRFAGRTDIAPVVYLENDIKAHELAALYRAADVLVAPYRGEGFCLPALEAMACGVPVIHTGTGPTSEFVPDGAGWAIEAVPVPLSDPSALPRLAGPAHVQEASRASLVRALRCAAADPGDRRVRGQVAGQAAYRYTWAAVGRRAAEALTTLAHEALPLARLACPDAVDVPPGRTLVLSAPHWGDDPSWPETLRLWSQVFTEDDEVTLAMPCADADPDALSVEIQLGLAERGVDLESLPDLMLCRPSVGLADLVAAADAVLVADHDRHRPELTRRALRLVSPTADELNWLRSQTAAQPTEVPALAPEPAFP